MNAIPVVSEECQYLFAKYLITHKLELERARLILDRLIGCGFMREDIFELYVESLSFDKDDGETNDVETDSNTRKYILRSYHMFPWRQNSLTLFQCYRNSIVV